MYILMTIAFVVGYAAIALEHPLKIDKAASALLTAVICWVLLVVGQVELLPGWGAEAPEMIENSLMHHLGEIGGILFFLMGAMTIVEIIDAHGGFSIITDKITTLKKSRLLIILSLIAFVMSAALDNLTTSIIMATLLRKLIHDKKDLWTFAGVTIIAANAGGAWSPIGDVTTIMLWIGGQVTAANIVLKLFIPSLVCLLVPLIFAASRMKGNLQAANIEEDDEEIDLPQRERKITFYMGIAALVSVPVFKTLTHLPPFMGILLGLSVLWIVTEILHKKKNPEIKKALSIGNTLQKIDTTSILFFLGILLAVGALQTAGQMGDLANLLEDKIGNIWFINILIGVFSAIVDNVPLVAGAMGMYDLNVYATDHTFWELLAYCAGTGGSILIIGSAAGVAIMGILKIDFIWYLKNITLLALMGYLSGVGVFYLLNMMM
jgi:Na+/H+ antiporter NhaD/arsenite permease-like protein